MEKNQTVNKNGANGRKVMDMRPIKSVNHRIQTPKSRITSQEIKRGALNRKPKRNMDVSRNNNVSKFTKNQKIDKIKTARVETTDINHTRHPLIAKTEAIRANKIKANQPIPEKPAKQIKDEAIEKALNAPKVEIKKTNLFKRHYKKFNILSVSAVLIVVAGFLAYIYMPFLSVNIASAQAGISATYPEYKPDGYSLSGPVSYSNGEVTISFSANTGSSKFTIKQSKSSWDSSAVKNKVNKDAKGEFTTTEEKGLTIYTYNGNASWVNGGILYNITGDAPLSGDQIRRIATSL